MTIPMQPKTRTSQNDALVGLWTIGLAAFIIAALYFGRELLTPIALAALLTFLLTPLVSRLQRFIGRIGAVLVIVGLMFTLTVGAGWVLTRQIVDLGSRLPDYKENIRVKIKSFELPSGGAFTKLSEAFDDLKKDIPGLNGDAGRKTEAGIQALEPQADREPIPVEVVSSPTQSVIELSRLIIAPVVGPLGTAALVLLLVIFMLLKREDVRNRLIRLIGQGRIGLTTGAMDDAAGRVSRYLVMQLVVNVTYGMALALGLWLIDIPNAILWGTLAAVLRFIPYVGPWIAAVFPVVLSLAVSTNWWAPALTVGLFIVLELLSNNVMEPWLYGSSTGVSSLALIIAAVFWTYIWGPVGLVMSTPITVCMAVMGRHIPRLAFLNILLSDEEALTPAEDCYHRLLRTGGQDELELAESYLRTHTLTDFYDSMLVPALITGERDHHRGALDKDQINQLETATGDLLEEIEERLPGIAKVEEAAADLPTPCEVFCMPAKGERDRLAGEMLAQLLRRQKIQVTSGPANLTAAERAGVVAETEADIVCISVTEPTTISQARYLCAKVRAAAPERKILIGLWGTISLPTDTEKALIDAGADAIVKNIAAANTAIRKIALALDPKMEAAPIPAGEEARLKALEATGLLESAQDYTSFTKKLCRIFGAPIAVLSVIDGRHQHFKAATGLPDELSGTGKTPRDVSICGHVVAGDETIIVEDLARDRRFSGNPLVKEHGFRFYAGTPVRTPEGAAIGTLCLIDTVPRELSEREERMLEEFAADVSDEIARAARG